LKARVVDANVVIDLLDPGSRRHAIARDLFRAHACKIHMINMAEVVSLICRRRPEAKDRLLAGLFSFPELEVSYAAVEVLAGEMHSGRGTEKTSLADCVGSALALASGVPFVSADRDLLSLARRTGVALELLEPV